MSKYDELNTAGKDWSDTEKEQNLGLNDDDYDGHLSDELPDQPSSDEWTKRWFAPLTGGSLRGSTIAFASITFGVGCLSFPQAFADIGLIPGLTMFIVICLLSYWSLYVLILAARRKRTMHFQTLIKRVLGKGIFYTSEANNMLLLFGILIAYEKAISDIAMTLLNIFFGLDPKNSYTKLIQMIICMMLQFFTSLLRDMSKLQYVGMLGGLTLLYTMFVIIIESPFYFIEGKNEGRSFDLFKTDYTKYLSTFSIFLFGFASHNGILAVIKELKRPNSRRTMKVLNRAMALEIGMYGIIGLAGFFSIIESTPSPFITRPPLKIFGKIDYFIIVAQVLLVFCLTGSCAIIYNILRGVYTSLIFNGGNVSFFVDMLITLCFYLITNTIAYLVDNINTVLGVLGGFCGVNICYIIPILCYIYTNGQKLSHWTSVGSFIIMAAVVITGYTAVILPFVHH